ncbi:MAG: hypothetical protein ACUVQ0_05740 [Thermoproteota archaeon]
MKYRKVMVIVIMALIVAIGVFLLYQYSGKGRSERIISLMDYANITDVRIAELFDEKYGYMAVNGKYNLTLLEFFSHWLLNDTLADTCISILKDVQEVNRYLSSLESYAVNYGFRENLTLVLSARIDRREYYDNDVIILTINVLSNKDLGRVPLDIFGFKSYYKHRGYIVNNKWIIVSNKMTEDSLEIQVNKGLNTVSFKVDVPSCSPCYGISSGLHNLTSVIRYNDMSISVMNNLILRSKS